MHHVPTPLTLSPDFSPLVTHPTYSPITHPITQPITWLIARPITHFSYTTPTCLATCYTCHSCVMCMTMGSAQFFANVLSNCSHIVRWALPTIVAAHFCIIYELSICLGNFYDTLYFILQIIPYMFCPPSIRLLCCVQMFLENTYVQLWLNLV